MMDYVLAERALRGALRFGRDLEILPGELVSLMYWSSAALLHATWASAASFAETTSLAREGLSVWGMVLSVSKRR